MIPADIDPSLRATEPLLDSLDDGFSPPARDDEVAPVEHPTPPPPATGLGPKSPF